MLRASFAVSILGPIAEIWYSVDYWKPIKISGYIISIEDFLFAFALGGISFGLYKFIFKTTVSSVDKYPRRNWLIIFCIIVITVLLVIFNTFLYFNSVVVTSMAFIVISIIIWYLRPDLIRASAISGLLHLILFFGIYQFMILIFPDIMNNWCLYCNPSNIRILGINIEEMFWDFTWGLVGGVLYEAVSGKEIKSLNKRFSRNTDKYISKFSSFDRKTNELKSVNLKSKFGKYMLQSTLSVLIIRIEREIAHLLSKKIGYNKSLWYARLLIILSPLFIEMIFAQALGFSTKGVALGWVFYYMILTASLLTMPNYSWLHLMKVSDEIDGILTGISDKRGIIKWMESRLNLKIQVALSILGGISGVIALAYISPFFSIYLEFGLASYAQVFLNALLGTNAVYWLWQATFLLRRLTKFSKLGLTWYYPIDTPAITKLSRLLAISSFFSLFGMVLTIFPLFLLITLVGSAELVFLSTLIFFVTLSTVLFVTIFPQHWLIKIVKRERNQLLSELHNEIGKVRVEKSPKVSDQLDLKYLLYHNIRKMPLSNFDIKTIFNYFVAIVLAFFPYFIKLIIRFFQIK